MGVTSDHLKMTRGSLCWGQTKVLASRLISVHTGISMVKLKTELLLCPSSKIPAW